MFVSICCGSGKSINRQHGSREPVQFWNPILPWICPILLKVPTWEPRIQQEPLFSPSSPLTPLLLPFPPSTQVPLGGFQDQILFLITEFSHSSYNHRFSGRKPLERNKWPIQRFQKLLLKKKLFGVDDAGKWNKYQVGLSKLILRPHELQGKFCRRFFFPRLI